ncbi:MAG TPA: hypothetical protein VIC87_08120 [Vicinamibacteria bacterium]
MDALVPPPRNTHHRPELEPRLAEAHRKVREAELEAAAVLEEVRESGHHRAVGCASIYEYGERRGFSGREVATLLQAQAAVKAEEDLRARYLDRRLSLEAVAALQQVIATPALHPEKEHWIRVAEQKSAKEFRRDLWRRLDQLREAPSTWPLTMNLSEPRWWDFERLRAILAKKGPEGELEVPTPTQTFETMLDDSLDKRDILREKDGKRRLPDTTGVKGRYVPAEVRRLVHKRTMGKCVILKCMNTIRMHVMHEDAACLGGSREKQNLGLGCSMHHRLKDSKIIENVGTVEEPLYVNRFGEELLCRRAEQARAPPGPPRETKPPETKNDSGGLFP